MRRRGVALALVHHMTTCCDPEPGGWTPLAQPVTKPKSLRHIPTTLVGLNRGAPVRVQSTLRLHAQTHGSGGGGGTASAAGLTSLFDPCVQLVKRWVVNAGCTLVDDDDDDDDDDKHAAQHIYVGSGLSAEALARVRLPYIAVATEQVRGVQGNTGETQAFLAAAAAVWTMDLPDWDWLGVAAFMNPSTPRAIVPCMLGTYFKTEAGTEPKTEATIVLQFGLKCARRTELAERVGAALVAAGARQRVEFVSNVWMGPELARLLSMAAAVFVCNFYDEPCVLTLHRIGYVLAHMRPDALLVVEECPCSVLAEALVQTWAPAVRMAPLDDIPVIITQHVGLEHEARTTAAHALCRARARAAAQLAKLATWDGSTCWLEKCTEADADADADDPIRICLCMIVRDESALIEGTLRMLAAVLPHWVTFVIADTGSVDATVPIMAVTLKALGVRGHLLSTVWSDFATNRTQVLRAAHTLVGPAATHLFLWDADDIVVLPAGVASIPLPPPPLASDMYRFEFEAGSDTAHALRFWRPVLLSASRRWKYVGVVHELLVLDEAREAEQGLVPKDATNFYVEAPGLVFQARSAGARSRQTNKSHRDAAALEQGLTQEVSGCSMWCRYAFYLGNTYRDMGDVPNATRVYRMLLAHPDSVRNSWVQERYVAGLRLGSLLLGAGDAEGAVMAWLRATNEDPSRIETVYELVNLFTIKGDYHVAYGLSQLGTQSPLTAAVNTTVDTSNQLFVDTSIAAFYFPYVMVIVCQRTGHLPQAQACYHIIAARGYIPPGTWHLDNLFGNMRYVPGVTEPARRYFAMVQAARPDYVPSAEAHQGLGL